MTKPDQVRSPGARRSDRYDCHDCWTHHIKARGCGRDLIGKKVLTTSTRDTAPGRDWPETSGLCSLHLVPGEGHHVEAGPPRPHARAGAR